MAGKVEELDPEVLQLRVCRLMVDHEACHDQDQIEEPQLLPLRILIPLAILLLIMFLKRVAVYLFSFSLVSVFKSLTNQVRVSLTT